MDFCLLQMRLESLPELNVVGMIDHFLKGFDDLVFGGKQVTQLRGV
jgi:hypothetical protein